MSIITSSSGILGLLCIGRGDIHFIVASLDVICFEVGDWRREDCRYRGSAQEDTTSVISHLVSVHPSVRIRLVHLNTLQVDASIESSDYEQLPARNSNCRSTSSLLGLLNRNPRVGARIVSLSVTEEGSTIESAQDIDLSITDCSSESAPLVLHLSNHRPGIRCGIIALAVLPDLLPIVTTDHLEFSVEGAGSGRATEMMHWSHHCPGWYGNIRIEHLHRVHRSLPIISTSSITAVD
ncbi:hypothetical protein PMAYCL1PPCAC_13547, partial [Pristionchus mayeri]